MEHIIIKENECRVVDKVLQDSGDLWVRCLYTKNTITIHALVEDEEQAVSVIRSPIEGHPVFYHWYDIFLKKDNTT
jgi:hypothetical protein